MSTFKSYNPSRYINKKRYQLHISIESKELREECAICHAPFGVHRGNGICESKEYVERISSFRFNKTRKLSEKELMKRKFRKFLYDNDVLEAWTKLRREYLKSDSKAFSFNNPLHWINGAFYWSDDEEKGYSFWSELCDKWNEELIHK